MTLIQTKARKTAIASMCAVALLAGTGTASVSAAPVAVADTTNLGPQELMDTVSKKMFDALDSNRAAIRKDPEKAYPLVDQILLPHCDTEYAARLVLARHWEGASPEQRKRFVAALYHALLRLYGGAISDFTADRLKLLPFRGDPAAKEAVVHTLVRRDSGATVPVDYRLHKTDAGWLAYDVIIEGISYVKNYRTDLGAEVEQKGLDAVIVRLEREGITNPPTAKR